jgi:predicted RND superfamily exporter protein
MSKQKTDMTDHIVVLIIIIIFSVLGIMILSTDQPNNTSRKSSFRIKVERCQKYLETNNIQVGDKGYDIKDPGQLRPLRVLEIKQYRIVVGYYSVSDEETYTMWIEADQFIKEEE